MNIVFYIILFIMGITFGSFYTLAVYRIPKRIDIVHTHSYCPNCNHKLGFLDLIPVFSYIFLRGRCRYCKEKIRPRYFILEILSGIFFVITALCMGMRIETLTIYQAIDFAFVILFYTFIILMAGIDKEEININRPVLMYGVLVSVIYMAYLYIIEESSIYRYVIYLVIYVIILAIETISLRKRAQTNYFYGNLLTIIILSIFIGATAFILTIISTIITVVVYKILDKLINKRRNVVKEKEKLTTKIPVGFLLGTYGLLTFLLTLFCNRYLL